MRGQAPGPGDVGVPVLEAGMRRHDDASLLDPGPEGVEGGIGRGTQPPR